MLEQNIYFLNLCTFPKNYHNARKLSCFSLPAFDLTTPTDGVVIDSLKYTTVFCAHKNNYLGEMLKL